MNFQVDVERVFAIDRATMWSLWTDQEHAARWMRPSIDDYGPTVASVDARPNGHYRFEMMSNDGSVHAVSGQYVEVEEPRRLVFTWVWDGTEEESLVEVLLSETDEGTKVQINHTKLESQQSADRHEQGWIGCLNSIAQLY